METPQRIDFAALAANERIRETRTFTDPRRPGLEFTIEFEEPDVLSDFRAATLAKEIVRRYVTGDPSKEAPAFPFMVDGKARELTPELIWDLCDIVALQPVEDGSLGFAPYEFEDIAQMAFKCRGLYIQLRAFAREMHRRAAEALPNALPATG